MLGILPVEISILYTWGKSAISQILCASCYFVWLVEKCPVQSLVVAFLSSDCHTAASPAHWFFFFWPKLLLTSIIKYLSDHKQYLLQQDFTLPCQVCFRVSHLSPLSLYHLCVFVERKFVSYQPLLPSFETEAGLLRLGCFRSPHKGDWFSRWCEGSQSKNHEYSGHKGELSTFLVLRNVSVA